MVDKLKKWLFKQPSRSKNGKSPKPVNDEKSNELSKELSGTLKDNVTMLKHEIGHSTDFILRCLNDKQGNPVLAVAFLQGLIDQQILTTLLEELTAGIRNGDLSDRNVESWLMDRIPIGGITCLENEQALIHAVLYGQVALLVEGSTKAFAVSISGGLKERLRSQHRRQ